MSADKLPLDSTPDLEKEELLRSRSREAGFDLLKTLLTLSTGAVAFFFVQVSDGSAGTIPMTARFALVGALAAFVFATLLGLVGWFVNFKMYYYKALLHRPERRVEVRPKYERLKRLRPLVYAGLPAAFFFGVLLSAVYVCVLAIR